MALTITKITGIGNPPTAIQVEGTVSGCEKVYVTVSCSTDPVVAIDIPTGGSHPWSITYKNNLGCDCGAQVTASASCVSGLPAGATLTKTLPLTCDPPGCCDEVTITVDTEPLPCFRAGGGAIVILFSAALSPQGCTGPLEWKVTDLSTGTVIWPFTPGGSTFSYAFASAGTYKVNVKVQQASSCDDPLLTDSVTFTLVDCSTCAVAVSGPQTTPCTDGPPTPSQTYTATSTPAFAGPYTWEVRKPPMSPPFHQSQGGASFTFPFPGPGTYKVSVSIQTQGCTNPTASDSVIVTVPPCCPEILGPLISSPGNCTADRLRRRVTLDAMVNGSGVTQFVWTCGDGMTLTLPGSTGPQTTHEYAPGTYNVNLKVVGPGNCEANFPVQIVVDPCCPAVTDINVSPGSCPPGATTRPVTLSAQVAGSGMSSFDWNFGDGSPVVMSTAPTAPSHNYAAPGNFTAVVTAHTPNCPEVSATKSFTVAACPTTGGGGGFGLPSCAALLWAAIIFMLIGGGVSIVGCILAHFFPQAGLIVEIVGVALFAVGVILFLIWWVVCRLLTACAVILAVRAFVIVLIVVFAAIAVIIAIIAIFTPAFWPCAAAATAYGFSWGAVLAMLDWLAQDRKCIILNPSGGSSAAASSSGLTSSDSSTRLRVSDFSQRTVQAPAGWGDVIQSATSAIGIQPCAKCQERAERLNAKFPFGTTRRSPVLPGHSRAEYVR